MINWAECDEGWLKIGRLFLKQHHFLSFKKEHKIMYYTITFKDKLYLIPDPVLFVFKVVGQSPSECH